MPSQHKTTAIGKRSMLYFLSSLLLCFFTLLPAHASDTTPVLEPLPKEMEGQWRVKSVRINMSSERTLHYQYNDPSLLGHLIVIGPHDIQSNLLEKRRCQDPKLMVTSLSLASLIESTMAAQGYPPRIATATDYEFRENPATIMRVGWTVCESGHFGPYPDDSHGLPWASTALPANTRVGTWFMMLPQQQLAMRWYDETILILERSTDSKTPRLK
jgi:hypothetical protein